MPEKDGDEDKSTKSVVKKKQKQMMGEEGYDIARDMGRVRPSKDKKDATTMPPSKEMEKTRKVVKGPSAFERVKAKYGKSVMDVGKKKVQDEFDLTQVAEALGGYIVEAPVEDDKKSQKRRGRKSLTGNIPPEERGGEVDKDPDTEVQRRELSAQQDDKVRGEVSKQAKSDAAADNLISKIKQGKTKAGEDASKISSRRAKRIKGASGGKKTGSLRKGNLEFPGDRTGATQQAKADIEARKGFKSSKSGGLKDDERNPFVKRNVRQSRVDDLGGNIFDAPKVTNKDFSKSIKDVGKAGKGFIGPRETQAQVDKRLGKVEDPFKTSTTKTGSLAKNFKFQPQDVSTQQAADKVETGLKDFKKTYSQFSRELQDYRDRDVPGGPRKTKRDRPDITGAGGRNRPRVTGDVSGQSRQDVGMAPEDSPKPLKKVDLPKPVKKGGALIKKGGDIVTTGKGGDLVPTVDAVPVKQSLVSKVAKFSKDNPAAAIAGYDIGKGILSKIMKLRSPSVRGGKAGFRSAGSYTAT